MKITKDMTLGQLLDTNEGYGDILMGFGMQCFGCPMSRMETLEEAASVHGFDIDYMLEKLNEAKF